MTDAFGMAVTGSGSTPTPFGFVGQGGYQTDADTGLMLCGHRYYDASAGRFLSRDPQQAGEDWYTYCDNDPVNFLDSNGYDKLTRDQDQKVRDAIKLLRSLGGVLAEAGDRTATRLNSGNIGFDPGFISVFDPTSGKTGSADAATDTNGHTDLGPTAFSNTASLAVVLAHEDTHYRQNGQVTINGITVPWISRYRNRGEYWAYGVSILTVQTLDAQGNHGADSHLAIYQSQQKLALDDPNSGYGGVTPKNDQ